MKSAPMIGLAALSLLAAACDNPKPRPPPSSEGMPGPVPTAPAPMAAAPGAPLTLSPGPIPRAAGAPVAGGTETLKTVPGMAAFSIDYIANAQDPLNQQPAVIGFDRAVTIAGFAFDAAANLPAKGLDLVVDGKAYGAPYGAARPDVAAYVKAPAVTPVGFSVTFPAGTFAKGAHQVKVRVALADGKSAQEGAGIDFVVQ